MPNHTCGTCKKTRVRIRTYRHGLGDCHLLSFARHDDASLHMLIDCGIVELPGEAAGQAERMLRVARDIHSVTDGKLDIVVTTHQHTDHLSGFRQAEKIFDKIKIESLWMAWTEDRSNPLGRQIQDQLLKKLTTVQAAAEELAKMSGNTGATQAAAHIGGVLDFFGPAAAGERTQAILDKLIKKVSKPDYYSPGQIFALHKDVPNVRVYVLGPPGRAEDMKITNPRKKTREGYEFTLAAAANGLTDALGADEDRERSQPFHARHRIDDITARLSATHDDFFNREYFDPDPTMEGHPDWRQIESSWLEQAEQLALALDNYTNNTSLALAFEFTDTGEVLLFPGDAQIGSWLTWGGLEWEVPESSGAKRKVRIQDLLARTVFYKASHHASHNGTLSGLGAEQAGLEQMTSRDLVCVVPVDVRMSREKHWDRTLPWQPLLSKLREKTRGRLVLTDTAIQTPAAADLAGLSAAEKKRFTEQVVFSSNTDPEKAAWVDFLL